MLVQRSGREKGLGGGHTFRNSMSRLHIIGLYCSPNTSKHVHFYIKFLSIRNSTAYQYLIVQLVKMLGQLETQYRTTDFIIGRVSGVGLRPEVFH